MTDVRSTLARVADLAEAHPVPYAVHGDLARGRRALRRRRLGQGAGTFVLVVAAVAALRAVGPGVASPQFVGPSPTAAPEPSAPPTEPTTGPTAEPVTATPTPSRYPTVPLVAYRGAQRPGYEVAYVPKGWEIQGGNAFALVLAPVGFPDRRTDSFEDKLVVMLRSRDDTGTPSGDPVEVGGRTGYVDRREESFATTLTYQDRRGTWVQVQVPPTLGWTDTEIATFGEGVVVTGKAEPGRG